MRMIRFSKKYKMVLEKLFIYDIKNIKNRLTS
jgi:hypothetical protein